MEAGLGQANRNEEEALTASLEHGVSDVVAGIRVTEAKRALPA